jgi:hypothetical protein
VPAPSITTKKSTENMVTIWLMLIAMGLVLVGVLELLDS